VEEVARLLNFTFEIVDVPSVLGRLSFSDLLNNPDDVLRTALLSSGGNTPPDLEPVKLMISWWFNAPERMQHFGMVRGHVDDGIVLFTIEGPPVEPSLGQKFTTFLRPFTPGVWMCVLGLLMLSGLCDFILESGYGGSLSDSMQEVAAGALWGGFEKPKSKAAAAYQILVSFFVLVTIAYATRAIAASNPPRLASEAPPHTCSPRASRSAPATFARCCALRRRACTLEDCCGVCLLMCSCSCSCAHVHVLWARAARSRATPRHFSQ
jgi:hypothetical protein